MAETCDYCGKPVGFYGCPTHGVDCYDPEQHPEDDLAPCGHDAEACMCAECECRACRDA